MRLCATHNRQRTSLTSATELAVPALTQQLSCKANITTDLCRRVGLQAELQWKANPRDKAKHSNQHEKCRESIGPLRRITRAIARDVDAQQLVSDRCHPHNLCLTWTSRPTSMLPWSCNRLPTPAPMYAHKQHADYGRGTTEEKAATQQDTDQQGSAGSQCTLQIKGSGQLDGKPKPSWHLKVQKPVKRKTRLRGQISALLAPMTFLPSRWQMEARHRLPKGATFHARLQGEEVQQAGGCRSRHQLLLERKARDAWWTCTCARNSAGKQITSAVAMVTAHFNSCHHHRLCSNVMCNTMMKHDVWAMHVVISTVKSGSS